jgi:protein TonB
VRFENISYPCFLLSLAVHLALVPLLWRKPFAASPPFEPISVSFLPGSIPIDREKTLTAPPLPSRRQREPAPAKRLKRAPVVTKKSVPPVPQPEFLDLPLPPQLAARTEQPPETQERSAIVEDRPRNDQASIKQGETSIFQKDSSAKPAGKPQLLPGFRDLASYNRPIPLNTQDPILAPFTKKIESWIEAQWQYPDLAKHYGLQGKVTVEFTVLQDGHIDLLSVVRSSGSNLLDDEAVRAIKAAAPFPPIPRSIAANRLRIIAGFTYLNNRVAFTNNP